MTIGAIRNAILRLETLGVTDLWNLEIKQSDITLDQGYTMFEARDTSRGVKAKVEVDTGVWRRDPAPD